MYTVIGTASGGLTVLLDVRAMRLTHKRLPGTVYAGQIITDEQIAQRDRVNQAWTPAIWGLWPIV